MLIPQVSALPGVHASSGEDIRVHQGKSGRKRRAVHFRQLGQGRVFLRRVSSAGLLVETCLTFGEIQLLRGEYVASYGKHINVIPHTRLSRARPLLNHFIEEFTNWHHPFLLQR